MLIQKLRLQRGWSQEQLAEVSGLSVRTIQRLERGQTASVESLKALGAAFEIDFSDLKEPEMNSAMSQSLPADEALALAHVRKLKGFYLNLALYCIVISFLAIVASLSLVPVVGLGLGHRPCDPRSAGFRPCSFPERRLGAAAGREISRARTLASDSGRFLYGSAWPCGSTRRLIRCAAANANRTVIDFRVAACSRCSGAGR
jgi:transcriptional regulator with XRE-family HTH domain